ncbi:MAG: hypothetical protein ACD_37C00146G0002 [uncultured bacterium]|nr:MAG: hypothetical protein ACD_37C00146G0002 [uncultured bacterium]
MIMAIYTRKGDKGKTSLFDGTKVSKNDPRINAVGTIDELNSVIGIAIAQIPNPKSQIRKELEEIQNDLFEIGGALAFPYKTPLEQLEHRPGEFEELIDKLTEKLPELSDFILPGGGRAGSYLHLARTVCRRAERSTVQLSNKIDPLILIYLNRLSDLLFTFARVVNYREKRKEKIWRKR